MSGVNPGVRISNQGEASSFDFNEVYVWVKVLRPLSQGGGAEYRANALIALTTSIDPGRGEKGAKGSRDA